MRSRAEWAALAVVGALVVAFVASFFAGLGGGGEEAPRESLDVPAAVAPEPPSGDRPRVEVLNGSGRGGLARAATDRLRDAGFDVVYFGNASSAADSSEVLARRADIDPARAVARALDIGRVREAPDTTLLLDVTVILGRDWSPGRN